MTRRQKLISQLRQALNDLQSPAYFDYNETIEFDVGDTTFEYTEEDIEEEISY